MPGASVAEIKKAYRKLSRDKHPDKNPDIDTTDFFLELTEAKDILTDKEKRLVYDVFGRTSFQ